MRIPDLFGTITSAAFANTLKYDGNVKAGLHDPARAKIGRQLKIAGMKHTPLRIQPDHAFGECVFDRPVLAIENLVLMDKTVIELRHPTYQVSVADKIVSMAVCFGGLISRRQL